jgi:nitrogen fixation/metabolism regulation signal transduction histidine kinase
MVLLSPAPGLGLAIVHEVVNRHGTSLRVEAAADGRRTRIVCNPFLDAVAAPALATDRSIMARSCCSAQPEFTALPRAKHLRTAEHP